MRIRLPCAAPIPYNPAYYLERAFTSMGHQAEVIDQGWTYDMGPSDADLFVAVDSGGPLNLPEGLLPHTLMWYIDYRRNSDVAVRQPSDAETASRLLNGGGAVCLAQRPDMASLLNHVGSSATSHVRWLPLAADLDVWSDRPPTEPVHRCVTVSNCYDLERLGILNRLVEDGYLHWPGIEGAIMEDGAAIYRSGRCGLNVPSWFGTRECYDVNMRVFEVLSCGVPLITNYLSDLSELGILPAAHAMLYPTLTFKERDGDTVAPTVAAIKNMIELLEGNHRAALAMGRAGRELVMSRHTYHHRAETIIEFAQETGIL